MGRLTLGTDCREEVGEESVVLGGCHRREEAERWAWGESFSQKQRRLKREWAEV